MVRVRQSLVVLAGLVVAGIMVALGLWQMGVYQASGSRTAAERAAAPPIPLAQAAPPGVRITDGLGRSVTFSGTYDPALQESIPLQHDPARARVLTGIRLEDGRLLAVVRGITQGRPPAAPPSGKVDQIGVLLPSENSAEPGTSVRVPLLAQHWPGTLVDGYVNLSGELSSAQGLEPSTLDLPSAPGRLRNGAYALQWWLFAGFALLLAGRIARDLDRGHDLELAAEESPTAGSAQTTPRASVEPPTDPSHDPQRSSAT